MSANLNACSWCSTPLHTTDLSCPACGAGVDVTSLVSDSGWVQLPGRRDMAKLQFGQSYCQIEGKYVPVADVSLAGDDRVYFSHHVLLWKDSGITLQAMSLRSGWKRMLAGLPLVMTWASGHGHVAFSHDSPGEIIAVPLQVGQVVDVREGAFLLATDQVGYDWFTTDIWYTVAKGNERESFYPVGYLMDRFGAAVAPGLLLLHAPGNVFVRRLETHESILIQPSALVFKDPGVRMDLHFETPHVADVSILFSRSLRHAWLRLIGPGRVAVKSVTEPSEGARQRLISSSHATHHQW